MKKIFISLLIITLFPILSFGQGMYAKFNAGYYFPAGTQTLLFDEHTTATIDEQEPVNVSLGKGIEPGIAFGYMLSENFGAELGVSYLIGSKNEATQNDETRPRERFFELSGKSINFNPQILITGDFIGLKPFAKFGVVFGLASIDYRFEQIDNNNTTIEEWKYKGGIAIGFSADFGVEYALSEKLAISASFRTVNMSYAPTEGSLETFTVDGADELGNLVTRDKEIEFVDKIDYDIVIDDADPDQELKEKYPFSGFGLNIGVKYNF